MNNKRIINKFVLKLQKQNRKRAWWKRALGVMAAIVVFATTYNLILDAIAREEPVFCGMEEHTHSEENGCYTEEQLLVCELPDDGHVHTEDCYIVSKEQSCQREEHTHTLQCYSDPDADVETADIWERYAKSNSNTATNVLEVAKSQIGYRESEKNYLVTNETEKQGYTRYGAFMDDPYGAWNKYFVLFCLNYGNAPKEEIPAIDSEEIKPGYVAHLDMDGDGETDAYGIVSEVNENTLLIIEGNHEDAVKEVEYSVSDTCIMGYASLPGTDDDTEKTDQILAEEQELPRQQETESAKGPDSAPVLRDAPSGQISYGWAPSNSGTISARSLTQTPTDEGGDHVAVYQLGYALNSSQGDLPPYAVEIRVPQYVLTDWDGNPTGTYYVPLPEASNPGASEWCYSLDNTTGEIVITNCKTISSARALSCGIEYHYQPHKVQDGYTNSFQVKWSITDSQGSESVVSADNEITVNTDYPTPTAFKWSPSDNQYAGYRGFQFDTWQSAWGAAPADADDYFYIQWVLEANAVLGNQTMPYDITFEETPGSSGQLVGFAPYAVGSDGVGLIQSSNFIRTSNLNDLASHVQGGWDGYVGAGENSVRNDITTRVVMRYPRTLLQEVSTDVWQANVTNSMKVVYHGKDGTTKTATDTTGYTFVKAKFEAPPDEIKGGKSGNFTEYNEGAIDRLERGEDAPIRWSIYAEHKGYRKSENGTRPYTTVLRDNLTEYGSVLTNTDYTYTAFQIAPYSFYEQDILFESALYGDFDPIMSTDYENYGTIEVYVRTRGTSGWQNIGYIKHDTTPSVTVTSESYFYRPDGTLVGRADSGYQPIELPADTYDIQLIHSGTKAKVHFGIYLDTLLHPTNRVKGLIQNMDSYTLHNRAIVAGMPGTVSEVLDTVEDYPQKQAIYVDGDAELARVYKDTYARKMIKGSAPDETAHVTRVDYKLPFGEYILNNSNLPDALVDELLPEQRHGVFYDLLPLGATVDTGSIVVRDAVNREADYSYELIPNWRNTGRTMLKVTAEAKAATARNYHYDAWHIYDTSTTHVGLITGFCLEYSAYYDWQDIGNYGRTYHNSCAYVSEGAPMEDGFLNNGGNLPDPDKDLLANLTGEPTGKHYLYSDISWTNSKVVFQETGVFKRVKSNDDPYYVMNSAGVDSGGTYTYKLEYWNGSDSQTGKVVLYDILENPSADNRSNPNWRGTLVDVDVSNFLGLGVNASVRYCTSPNVRNYITAGVNSTAPLSLTAGNGWSATKPADPTTITAIAIVLQNAIGGGDYFFEPDSGGVAYVTMRAPSNVQGLFDDPSTPENEAVYAYNNAILRSGFVESDGTVPSVTFVQTPDTRVPVKAPDYGNLTVSKTLDAKEADLTAHQNAVFEIKVKLTGNSASTGTLCPLILPAGAPAGNPAEIPVDGQWHSVFLKHAQSINIDHIPFGVTYEVEEVPQSAATVSYENADGTISSVNGESAGVINHLGPEDLQIKKKVTGAGDLNKDFDISIEFTAPGWNAQAAFEAGLTEIEIHNPDNTTSSTPVNWSSYVDPVSGRYMYQTTIRHDQTIVLKGLPRGTQYEVNEADYTADGYVAATFALSKTVGGSLSTSDTNAGELDGAGDDTVTITNDLPFSGKLSFSKKVYGGTGDKAYRVQLWILKPDTTSADYPINEYLPVTVNSAVLENPTQVQVVPEDINQWGYPAGTQNYPAAEFWIMDGETIEIDNIPMGYQYFLSETNTVGTVVSSGTGYWVQSYGTLIGAGWEVSYTGDSRVGYENPISPSNPSPEVVINNVYAPALIKLRKEVSGYGDKNKDFPVRVEITAKPEEGEELKFASYYYIYGGRYGDDKYGSQALSYSMSYQGGIYSARTWGATGPKNYIELNIKDGEEFIIEAPRFANYKIYEEDSVIAEGYAVTYEEEIVTGTNVQQSYGPREEPAAGSLKDHADEHRVTINNHKVEYVDLSIKKEVVGNAVEGGEEFPFLLTLTAPQGITDADGNPVKFDINKLKTTISITPDLWPHTPVTVRSAPSGADHDVEIEFKLQNGQTFVLSEVFTDAAVTLKEESHEGYTVLYKDGNMTLQPEDDEQVIFTMSNDRDITVQNNPGLELPETGGIGTTIFHMGGFAMLLSAFVLLVTRLRMKQKGEKG